MKFGSICSGIEVASFRCKFFWTTSTEKKSQNNNIKLINNDIS